MSKPVEIQSAAQFSSLLQDSPNVPVVVQFYSASNEASKQLAPLFERLSSSLSKRKIATFAKVNTETEGLKALVSKYDVKKVPVFLVFRRGSVEYKVASDDPAKLQSVIEKLASDIENMGGSSSGTGGSGSSSSSGGASWRGADLPRGYTDISDSIDVKGLELLNAETDFPVRALFSKDKPSALDKGKSTSDEKDWVESDTDEQLLLFTPFNSAVKLHTLQITSLPPTDSDDDDVPMRPKTIKLFTNRPHNLGFDEAEDIDPTQTIEIGENDWNSNGTANIGLRFVRFQNITSLVIFVVDVDGDSEKVRLDRVRLIGESGEKREMGKLEKIGDEQGE
ncbi:Uu.00g041770.m01.CDS01 [Anthostomella pinea]|uniref:Uu.00g041770.m01.CDS01 n=1 Tax=Anthostomella pinea TaxID=933095 RepID=A0AAI8VAB6_9PEZI|nr:Uu.00g041770.m01.CDS01 [Anthostomella pinea]